MTTPGHAHLAALYPFLAGGAPSDGALAGALAEVRASTRQKCADVVALRRAILAECAEGLLAGSLAMAARFQAGGKLLAFGNGGSATDATDAVADCLQPPPAFGGWRVLPALDLGADVAVLTAVANDVGFEHVFARQVVAFGARGDIALGISTSGASPNVVAGLREARRRGLLTVGLTGYDGGAMAAAGVCDFCFVARHEHVPRIQEGQATIWHALLALVQERLAQADPEVTDAVR